jgi:hypothetical protein
MIKPACLAPGRFGGQPIHQPAPRGAQSLRRTAARSLHRPAAVNRIGNAGRMRTRQTSVAARLKCPQASPAFCDSAPANTQQAPSEHAILMSESERGWRWQVIDQNGLAVASGRSADQNDAMFCARRAIELSANSGEAVFRTGPSRA